ncbi:YceD family protein [Roseobacter ponti]|uniref:YceD family protein n=1 Tax=Roseobacter ponti TaxID=1891787 RepID=UPI00146F8DC9|nr:DUF177 domain-containing protein [Roseobacter ponti]
MKQTPPSDTALRVADLAQNAVTSFSLRPDTARTKQICAELRLSDLRKLSFTGSLRAEGEADWRLEAVLGATIVQPCGVTLEPVTTRIDAPVTRLFQRDFIDVDAPEAEMPEDDTTEALGRWIDPAAVMTEALVLAVPLYPRAPGAELKEAVFTEPGKKPMRDEDAKPFAGLAGLRDQLETPDGDD